jgi:hypothetical protein
MAKGRPRAGLFAGSNVPVTHCACAPQQTVDGLQAALEIGARSSYVPSAPTLAFDPRFFRRMRALTRRGQRAWNACYG